MNNQFRQFVESSPDAIMIVEPEGRIRHANGPAASLFGYDSERLRDESVRTIIPDQPLPLLSEDPGPAKHDAAGSSLYCRRGDASQFPAEVSVVRVQTRHGPTAVVTVRDMTEAQRAQFVLERSVQVLASEGRDRQLLFGHLVHAQEEERKRIAADIHDDTVQLITAANLRLQQLRHRLTRASRGQHSGQARGSLPAFAHPPAPADLRSTTVRTGSRRPGCRTAAALEQLRSESGIAYQLDDGLTSRLPADTSVLIYRIAREALTNVRKHARATTVRVELADLCDGCLVRIDDDGVGYNPADVENSPGHLGLVAYAGTPSLAGGWCRVESAPGAGTSVEFWAPYRSASRRAGDRIVSDPREPAVVIRVLIVEDHPVVAEGLASLLEDYPDLAVAGCAGSVAGVAGILEESLADVAVIDFHLPDGTGADAADHIRARSPSTAIVFLSADDGDEPLLAAIEAEANGYLLKSATGKEIVRAIRSAAGGETLIPAQTITGALAREARKRPRSRPPCGTAWTA